MLNRLRSRFESLQEQLRSRGLRQSIRNAGFNSLDFLLRPLLFLLATPVFISQLGTDVYGIWMLAMTVTGLSGLMAFGLGDATVRYVAKYRALGDSSAISRVIRSTFTLYLFLGSLACLLVFGLAPLLASSIFNVEPGHVELSVAALQVAGLGILVRFINGVFASALYGFERYDLAATTSMVASVSTVVTNLILVLLGFGVVALLVTSVAILLVDAGVKAAILKSRAYPPLNVTPLFDLPALREILSYGFYTWLQSLGGMLLGQLDKFIIVSLLSTTALTYYTVCLQLTSFIHSFGSRAISFIFPMSSILFEQGKTEQLREVYFHGQRAASVVAASLSVPVFLFAPQILTLWIDADFATEASEILRILSLAFAVMATSTVPYYFMNGTNSIRLNTVFSLASGLTVALGAALLIPSLGISGAAWARLLNIPVALVARTILHRRVLNDGRLHGGAMTIVPIAILFMAAVVSLWLLPGVDVTAPWWLIWGAGLGLLSGLICWQLAGIMKLPSAPASRKV